MRSGGRALDPAIPADIPDRDAIAGILSERGARDLDRITDMCHTEEPRGVVQAHRGAPVTDAAVAPGTGCPG